MLLLSTRAADELLELPQDADVLLIKPVMPEVLLLRVRELIARSRELRHRSGAACQKGHQLSERSTQLRERALATADCVDVKGRRCPGCQRMLEWIERGTIDGIEYDYYRWCGQGCGLYCFNRRARCWLKLA